MKHPRLFSAFALAFGLILTVLWLLGGASLTRADSPHHVALDCTSVPAPCHTSLQEAVDVAVTGDVILVAGGVYTGVHVRPRPTGYLASPSMTMITQVILINKTIMIRGGYTTAFTEPPDPVANPTTLNAAGQGRVMVIAGYISPTIEGLRLTHGDAVQQQGEGGPHDAGGGVYVLSATATLSNNQIFSNTAYSGGGLYLRHSAAILDGNAIVSNTGSSGGGGLKLIYCDQAVLKNNFVAANAAPSAGGLFVNYSNTTTLSGNTIVSNTATTGLAGGLLLQVSAATVSQNFILSNTAETQGGGAYVFGADNSVLSGNLISANRADSGGGLELYQSDTTLINNTISANTASNAALVLYYSNAALSENIIVSNTAGCGLVMRRSNATLTNTVVTDNRAATTGGCGLSIVDGSQPQLVHTTIARNGGSQGTGVNVSTFASQAATATLTNTIVSGHFWGIYIASGNTARSEGALWYSNTVDQYGAGFFISGSHNYWGDPHFAEDGYHLLSGSAAIDRGVNTGALDDIDGDSRPQGGGPELGADETVASDWYDIYLPLVIRN